MASDTRGLGKLKEEGKQDEVEEIASLGGQASPTKFTPGDPRAKQAGKKGGEARADDPDVKSGELGRKGAEARWGKQENDER